MVEQGQRPKALESRVDVREDLKLFWQGFYDLGTCRQVGFGIAPIPWTAMRTWAEAVGLSGHSTERAISLFQAMDAEYLEWSAKQSDRKAR